MAVTLRRSESGTQGLRRFVRKQIAKAREALDDKKLSDEAVHSARKELKKARATLRLPRAPSLDALRQALHREYTAIRHRILERPNALKPQRDVLRRIYERALSWPIGDHGWSVIGVGLKRVCRQGRKALAIAHANPSPENLHEWRKQVKYLWHQLQVLELFAYGARVFRLAGSARITCLHTGHEAYGQGPCLHYASR